MLKRLVVIILVVVFASVSNADEINLSGPRWPGSDQQISPGSDFFHFANGGWLKDNPIPPDRNGYSNATVLTLSVAAKVRTLLEEAAADADDQPVAERDRVGAYYRAFMDQSRVEALGARPLRASLLAIRQARSRSELASLMGHANSGFHGSLFKLTIEPDSRNPDRHAIYLGQGGLGSMGRSAYLAPDALALRENYRHYVALLLVLAGWDDAEAVATEVMAFETSVAAASWAAADQRDESKVYNPRRVSQLVRDAPGFSWHDYLSAARLTGARRIVVVERSAIPALAALNSKTSLPVLKAWAAFHLIDNAAPLLSRAFTNAWFDLHGRQLQGAQIPAPRWERALAQVSGTVSKDFDLSRGAMGDAVGRLYVNRWFEPRARDTLTDLVANLKATLRARISASDWMSAPAKVEPLKKVDAYKVQIDAPAHGDKYDGLVIRRDDLFGDVERATACAWEQQRQRLGHATDRERWTMTPQTVNAYNYAPFSVVVFTAALLQPPAFEPTQDAALTYGGIGAIIGHELTHAFDDVGR